MLYFTPHALQLSSWSGLFLYVHFQGSAIGVILPSLKMDSQVKYGLLSRGDAAVFMRFPPSDYREKIWDHAAGVLIVLEAGGKVKAPFGHDSEWVCKDFLAICLH